MFGSSSSSSSSSSRAKQYAHGVEVADITLDAPLERFVTYFIAGDYLKQFNTEKIREVNLDLTDWEEQQPRDDVNDDNPFPSDNSFKRKLSASHPLPYQVFGIGYVSTCMTETVTFFPNDRKVKVCQSTFIMGLPFIKPHVISDWEITDANDEESTRIHVFLRFEYDFETWLKPSVEINSTKEMKIYFKLWKQAADQRCHDIANHEDAISGADNEIFSDILTRFVPFLGKRDDKESSTDEVPPISEGVLHGASSDNLIPFAGNQLSTHSLHAWLLSWLNPFRYLKPRSVQRESEVDEDLVDFRSVDSDDGTTETAYEYVNMEEMLPVLNVDEHISPGSVWKDTCDLANDVDKKASASPETQSTVTTNSSTRSSFYNVAPTISKDDSIYISKDDSIESRWGTFMSLLRQRGLLDMPTWANKPAAELNQQSHASVLFRTYRGLARYVRSRNYQGYEGTDLQESIEGCERNSSLSLIFKNVDLHASIDSEDETSHFANGHTWKSGLANFATPPIERDRQPVRLVGHRRRFQYAYDSFEWQSVSSCNLEERNDDDDDDDDDDDIGDGDGDGDGDSPGIGNGGGGEGESEDETSVNTDGYLTATDASFTRCAAREEGGANRDMRSDLSAHSSDSTQPDIAENEVSKLRVEVSLPPQVVQCESPQRRPPANVDSPVPLAVDEKDACQPLKAPLLSCATLTPTGPATPWDSKRDLFVHAVSSIPLQPSAANEVTGYQDYDERKRTHFEGFKDVPHDEVGDAHDFDIVPRDADGDFGHNGSPVLITSIPSALSPGYHMAQNAGELSMIPISSKGNREDGLYESRASKLSDSMAIISSILEKNAHALASTTPSDMDTDAITSDTVSQEVSDDETLACDKSTHHISSNATL
jgi:hypothetical protein